MKNTNIGSPTAAKIFAAWKRRQNEEPRRYIGASVIGHECDAYLWLFFRQAVRENFDGRTYRLFDRGKREEAVFCADLRSIGCEVKEFDDDGNQLSVSALGGHFGGHLDGIVRGLDEAPTQWHVVEFKTHSDASFRKLSREGVRKAKPMHYAQMQTYMGLMRLDAALYMAVDKDNDDLWCERVKFSRDEFDAIMARARRIIDASEPERCSTRRDDYRCKACPCASVCWHESSQFVDPNVPVTCRTCCHATADTSHHGAHWTCRLGHECFSGECDDHLWLPAFVLGEATEGDEYGILYGFEYNGNTDGITIGKRGFSSKEVQNFGPDKARDMKRIREAAPGSRVVGSCSLAIKYSDKSRYSTYFEGTREELSKWCEANPIADFSKPIRTESDDNAEYYEYAPSTLVIVNANGRTCVIFEHPPF